MSKIKTTFFCQNCGAQYAKWQGQCNSCKEWNTIAEEIIQKEEKANWNTQAAKKARSYIKLMAFSRQGLFDQLVFDGFTSAQASYGVKAVGY